MDDTEAKRWLEVFLTRIDVLRDHLTTASSLWDEQDSDRQRHSAAHALVGVLELLHGFEDLHPLSKPLRQLRNALAELNNGRSARMLKPAPKADRQSRLTTADRMRRYYAVMSVELLIAAGLGVDKAVTSVVTAFGNVRMDRRGTRHGRRRGGPEPATDRIDVPRLKKWREDAAPYGDDSFTRGAITKLVTAEQQAGRWPLSLVEARKTVERFAALAVHPDV